MPSYHGYRFSPEIISHAVWLYHRAPQQAVALLHESELAACRTWAWQTRAEATWHLCERRPVSLCREGRFDRNGDCILAIGR